jgi:phage major head subunit gpT-like protein
MPRTVTPALIEAASRGFKTSFQRGFSGYTAMKDQLATTVMSTAAVEDYGWVGDMPKLREWIGDRVIKGLAAHEYSLRNRKFELTIGVSRDDIEDDRLGIYATRFELMGESAAQHPDEIMFALINQSFALPCYDGQPFFDADHPVGKPGEEVSVSNVQAGASEMWILADLSRPLKPFIFQQRRGYEFTRKEDGQTSDHVFMRDEYLYGVDARVAAGFGFWQMAFGSKADLTAENLRAAYNAMRAFTDDEGRPLGVKPTHLIVGNTNHFAARDILMSEQIDGSTNTNRNLVQIIEAPLLV